MKFKKRLTKTGNSSHIIVDKLVRDTEKIKNGDEVLVTITKIRDRKWIKNKQ